MIDDTDLRTYLATRRSSLSVTLDPPGPDRNVLQAMLQTAARTPDHGKLAPWRFEIWSPGFRQRLHIALTDHLDGRPDMDDRAKKRAGLDKLLHAPTLVAVVSTAAEHPKVPRWEQILSAGAVCMNLLHAAHAHGFGAQWLTAWYIYDEQARGLLPVAPAERIAGLIHIGTSGADKIERDRPELDALVTERD